MVELRYPATALARAQRMINPTVIRRQRGTRSKYFERPLSRSCYVSLGLEAAHQLSLFKLANRTIRKYQSTSNLFACEYRSHRYLILPHLRLVTRSIFTIA